MKTKTSAPADGRVTITISAESSEVDEAILYLTRKCASENGVDLRQSADLEFDLRAKVGSEYLAAYLSTQVPLFLAAKAVGIEKLQTVLNPELLGSRPRVIKGRSMEFSVSAVLKPAFTLSSYEPVTIDVPNVSVSEQEIESQLYMVAQSFSTYSTDKDGQPDTSTPIIPAVTDAWVKDNIPDAETVEDLRAILKQNALSHKQQQQQEYIGFVASSELARRLEGTIPTEIFELTRNDLLSALQKNLGAQGQTMTEFIAAQGGEQAFNVQTAMQTAAALSQGYALDALAAHLNMRLTAADIDRAFTSMAPGYEDIARAEFEFTGRMYIMEEAAMRIKATLWLVEHANINYLEADDIKKADKGDKPTDQEDDSNRSSNTFKEESQ